MTELKMPRSLRGALSTCLILLATASCAGVRSTVRSAVLAATSPVEAPVVEEKRREDVAAHPRMVTPTTDWGVSIQEEALAKKGTRILISTETRALWLLRDDEALVSAPIAVGRSKRLVYKGIEYDFTTPLGKRKVQAKATTPIWIPPDWHYFEIAVERQLEPVHLKKGQRVILGDSTVIEARGNQVGRINRLGNFWPFTPGKEIIFDGKIFIPPLDSEQRRVPEVLGTHKLEMGSGYLIHGTNEEFTIGEAVSHGCVRMYNEDVHRLYELVPVGTPVYIF